MKARQDRLGGKPGRAASQVPGLLGEAVWSCCPQTDKSDLRAGKTVGGGVSGRAGVLVSSAGLAVVCWWSLAGLLKYLSPGGLLVISSVMVVLVVVAVVVVLVLIVLVILRLYHLILVCGSTHA